MDFLPFLRDASQYSAAWIVIVWAFLGLQMEFRMRGLVSGIHDDLHGLEMSVTKQLAKHGERLSSLEGKG